MWKHRVKAWAREGYARLLYHTGLHRLANRLAPRRLTILAGHCVTAPSNGFLPPDMKIAPDKLRAMMRWFQRHYDVCTVAEGFERLDAPERGGRRGMLALSMDDGYRDNAEVLLPLMQELGAPATVYLETGALEGRDVNWSHKYFWLLSRWGIEALGQRYVEATRDAEVAGAVAEALAGERAAYRVKRVLKYEAEADERDRTVEALFAAEGGDSGALCRELYMGWDEAQALLAGGFELGGHTVHHPILARLEAGEQERELSVSTASIGERLGRRPATFAYPFGRAWDFDEESVRIVSEHGYAAAVTSHAGANLAGADRWRLKRWMIDDDCKMHLLVAEACGGFALLERLGLRLSE